MDHGNLAGSALLLVLLRPHLYMDRPVPLRLFGYPAPAELLEVDQSPQSSRGPDNMRTNLVEALCAHLNTLAFDAVGDQVLHALQDAWHMMRIRIDLALQAGGAPAVLNAHSVIVCALQVPDNVIMQPRA